MEPLVLGVAAVVMVAGLVGVVVPVLPGLVLVWLASAGSMVLLARGLAGWLVAALLTALFAVGTAATIWLPVRQGRRGGLDGATIGFAVAGALVGFFVIPVVGLVVGLLVGILLGERRRHGEWTAARRSTGGVLRAYGFGVVVELLAGVAMVVVWIVAVLVRT